VSEDFTIPNWHGPAVFQSVVNLNVIVVAQSLHNTIDTEKTFFSLPDVSQREAEDRQKEH